MSTPLSNEEYLAKRGLVCPFCHKGDMLTPGPARHDYDPMRLRVTVNCGECNAEWDDVYVLSNYEDAED